MLLKLEKGSLQRNVFFMLLGNGVYAFSQWIQISMISKFESTETLGYFTLALSIVAPIFMFLGMQLRTVMITDVQMNFKFKDFFYLRFILNIIGILVILIVCVTMENLTVLYILILLAFQKIFESFSELFNSNQQRKENIDLLAYSLFFKGLTNVLAMLIGLVFFNSILVAILLSLLFLLLVICFYDFRLYGKCGGTSIKLDASKEDLMTIFKRGFPLGIVLLIISLNSNIAKYFLEIYEGTKIQGIYSSISYILVIGLFVLDALGQVFVPRLSKYFISRQFENFKKLVLYFIGISFCIGFSMFIFSLLFGEFILKVLFNQEISKYSLFLSEYLFVSILVFISSSLGYILTSIGAFRIQPYINIVVLIINLILSFLLIKNYGLKGTLVTLTICFSVQIALYIFTILKNYRKEYYK